MNLDLTSTWVSRTTANFADPEEEYVTMTEALVPTIYSIPKKRAWITNMTPKDYTLGLGDINVIGDVRQRIIQLVGKSSSWLTGLWVAEGVVIEPLTQYAYDLERPTAVASLAAMTMGLPSATFLPIIRFLIHPRNVPSNVLSIDNSYVWISSCFDNGVRDPVLPSELMIGKPVIKTMEQLQEVSSGKPVKCTVVGRVSVTMIEAKIYFNLSPSVVMIEGPSDSTITTKLKYANIRTPLPAERPAGASSSKSRSF